MLCPFLPRNPHLLARLTSSVTLRALGSLSPFGVSCLRPSNLLDVPPPRIAATDEWAQRACLRMAEVTVMHSVTTKATGSTATLIAPGLAEPSICAISWSILAARARLCWITTLFCNQINPTSQEVPVVRMYEVERLLSTRTPTVAVGLGKGSSAALA